MDRTIENGGRHATYINMVVRIFRITLQHLRSAVGDFPTTGTCKNESTMLAMAMICMHSQ